MSSELKTRDDVDRSIQAIDKQIARLFERRCVLSWELRQRKARRSCGHKPLSVYEVMQQN